MQVVCFDFGFNFGVCGTSARLVKQLFYSSAESVPNQYIGSVTFLKTFNDTFCTDLEYLFAHVTKKCLLEKLVDVIINYANKYCD